MDIFIKLLLAIVGLFWIGGAAGCAGEMAANKMANAAAATAAVLANKVPVQSGHMTAGGHITNPSYTGEFLYVQGVRFNIRLDGVELRGELYGEGKDGTNAVEPAVAVIVDRAMNGDRDAILELIKYIRDHPQAGKVETSKQPEKP
jgi:hypothetical protein